MAGQHSQDFTHLTVAFVRDHAANCANGCICKPGSCFSRRCKNSSRLKCCVSIVTRWGSKVLMKRQSPRIKSIRWCLRCQGCERISNKACTSLPGWEATFLHATKKKSCFLFARTYIISRFFLFQPPICSSGFQWYPMIHRWKRIRLGDFFQVQLLASVGSRYSDLANLNKALWQHQREGPVSQECSWLECTTRTTRH